MQGILIALILLSAAVIALGIYTHKSVERYKAEIRFLETTTYAKEAKKMSDEELLNSVYANWGRPEQGTYEVELINRFSQRSKSDTSESSNATEESTKDNQ